MEVYGFDGWGSFCFLKDMTLGPNGHLWVSTKAGLVVSHVPLDDDSATSSVTFRKTVGEVRLSESALDASECRGKSETMSGSLSRMRLDFSDTFPPMMAAWPRTI